MVLALADTHTHTHPHIHNTHAPKLTLPTHLDDAGVWPTLNLWLRHALGEGEVKVGEQHMASVVEQDVFRL